MHTIRCQDCRAEWGVTWAELQDGRREGRFTDPGPVPYYVGTCDTCLRKHAAVDEAAIRAAIRRSVPLQMRRIANRVLALRSQGFTAEVASLEAVSEDMQPGREPDAGFRAYLIERIPRDDSGGSE